MKLKDKVWQKDVAGLASIVEMTITRSLSHDGEKTLGQTRYLAKYPNGTYISFYGYDIGKTVFKHEPLNDQTSLFDIIK